MQVEISDLINLPNNHPRQDTQCVLSIFGGDSVCVDDIDGNDITDEYFDLFEEFGGEVTYNAFSYQFSPIPRLAGYTTDIFNKGVIREQVEDALIMALS